MKTNELQESKGLATPEVSKRILFYVLIAIHTPWTIVRAFFALILILDLWCDKIIHGFIRSIK